MKLLEGIKRRLGYRYDGYKVRNLDPMSMVVLKKMQRDRENNDYTKI